MERFVNIALRLGLRPGGRPHHAENETWSLFTSLDESRVLPVQVWIAALRSLPSFSLSLRNCNSCRFSLRSR